MRLRRWLLFGGLAVGAAGAVGVAAIWFRPVPPHLNTAVVDEGPIEVTFSGTGPLSAVATVQVGCQVSGPVEELHADFNSRVKEKALLARIDPALPAATLEQADAAVAIAEADRAGAEAAVESALALLTAAEQSLASAEAGVGAAEASVSAAEAAVESARATLASSRGNQDRNAANLRQAELTRDRTLELFAKKLTSSQERDQAVNDALAAAATLKVGEADVRRAEAELRRAEVQVRQAQADLARAGAAKGQAAADILKAEAGVGQARASLKGAEARLKQTEAQRRRAQVDVDYCTIRSPIDGVVVNRMVDVGQTVVASFQTATLFTLARDLSKMQVEAGVNEGDIGRVRPGTAVKFRVDAHPDRKFPGTVRQVRLNPKTVNNVVEYTVIVDADNPDGLLLPGMTADVTFEVARKEKALRLPNAAVRLQPPPELLSAEGRRQAAEARRQKPEPGVVRVWVEDPAEPGKIRPVYFKAGLRDTTHTEVADGTLEAGARVVTHVRKGGPAPVEADTE